MIKIEVDRGKCRMRVKGPLTQCLSEAIIAVNRLYVNFSHEDSSFGEMFREAVMERGLPWMELVSDASVEISVPDAGAGK